jgi:acyl carrier protein
MDQMIESRLMKLAAEVLRRDASRVTLAARFVEDLEANSLDVVELICRAEAEFGVVIPESRLGALRTVGDVVALIRERS